MLAKVGLYMAQLTKDEINSMEQYLTQMERAQSKGMAIFAQTDIEDDLASIADFLIQLDD